MINNKENKRSHSDLKQAYEKLKEAHGEIVEAYEDMLLRLAIASEYKDPGIGGHIRRVSDYSTAIARSLGLPEGEVLILRYASMMHDIGKVGIPDRILEKEAALTLDERKEMETHTIIGNSIFEGSGSPMIKAAAEIALSHHEKYDGTGYPKGLKGEGVPLYSRIVAVADHFDAFVSKRVYKIAHSFDSGLVEIEQNAGIFFDPQVVIAFIKIRDMIKGIFSASGIIEDFAKNGS
jgi:putative two-component system response regulator